MAQNSEFLMVHVRRPDAPAVIEEYRQKGYTLNARVRPTVIAQEGFEKLVFISSEDLNSQLQEGSKSAEVGLLKRLFKAFVS
jgi:hypothetical protein